MRLIAEAAQKQQSPIDPAHLVLEIMMLRSAAGRPKTSPSGWLRSSSGPAAEA